MKKESIRMFSICLLIILLLSLSACNYYEPESVQKNIEVNILSCCDATQQDFEKYNNAFSAQEIKFAVDNYRLVKVTYRLMNNNDFSILIDDVESIRNNNFYLPKGCVDFEPTYPIASNQSVDFDVYIYVDKELTDEQNIIDELNNADIIFDIIRCNDN